MAKLDPADINLLHAIRRLLLSAAAFIQKYTDNQTVDADRNRTLLLIGQKGHKIRFDYDPDQSTLSLQHNDQPPEHFSPPDIRDLYRYIQRVHNTSEA